MDNKKLNLNLLQACFQVKEAIASIIEVSDVNSNETNKSSEDLIVLEAHELEVLAGLLNKMDGKIEVLMSTRSTINGTSLLNSAQKKKGIVHNGVIPPPPNFIPPPQQPKSKKKSGEMEFEEDDEY